jgi:hypothetical protein
MQQARFEQAEDGEARMTRARVGRPRLRQHGVEEARIVGGVAGHVGAVRPLVQQQRQRLAAAALKQYVGADLVRRNRGQRRAMGGDEGLQRSAGGRQRLKRREQITQQRRRGGPVGVGEQRAGLRRPRMLFRGRACGDDAAIDFIRVRWGRQAAQHADLQRARRRVEVGTGPPAARQRGVEHRQHFR